MIFLEKNICQKPKKLPHVVYDQKMNDLRENNVAKVDMKINFDELNKCNNYSKGEWAKDSSA